jgi:membrane protein YdbS with pleckstrin-like domain
MAKIDEIKEQIGLNKFIMGLISVIIFSITGFVVTNYLTMKSSLLIVIFLTLIVLIYIFMIVFSKTIDKIKELKDL